MAKAKKEKQIKSETVRQTDRQMGGQKDRQSLKCNVKESG